MTFPCPRSVSATLNLLILIAVLPILGILIHSSIEQRRQQLADAEREVMMISRSMAEVLTGITESVRQTLATLAAIEAFREANATACSALLQAIAADNPRILNLALTDTAGLVLAASSPFDNISLADRRHVQQAVNTQRFAAGEHIVTRIGTASSSFSYAYPVPGPDGQIRAVLTAVLFLDTIAGFLDFSKLPDGSFMAITDHQGIRLLYYPVSETNPIGGPIRAESWNIARYSNQAQLFRQQGSDGMTRIFAVEPLRLTPEEPPYLYAWAGIPEERILQPVNALLLRNLLLTALVTGLAMAASLLIGKLAFITPIRRLVTATAGLAQGQLDTRSGLAEPKGEIGTLAMALDKMADSLQRGQDELRRREFHLEEAQRIAHIGSWEWDAEHDTFIWSKELYRIFEIDPADSPPPLARLETIIDSPDLNTLSTTMLETLRSGTAFELELQLRLSGGTTGWLSVRGERVTAQGLRGTALDISARKLAEIERESLQEQLLHAQKLESIGRLAGGVAHDFNNMLGVIIGYTELSLEATNPKNPVYSNLQEIHTAARRSSDLVRQLLAFARRQTAKPQVLNLNETIGDMLAMLQRLIGTNVDLLWQPQENLAPVFIDPGQVDQILANLCVNARDAMDGAGRITIQTHNVEIVDRPDHALVRPPSGTYVQIVVSDTGCGMDDSTQKQIFEPFFTTKEFGKGTGLGLSTVFGIVRQNNGFIEVLSQPGRGTSFIIFLPRHRKTAANLEVKRP